MPWWLALLILGLATVGAAELHLGAPGLRAWLPYAVIIPLTVVALWWVGRLRVAVENGELWVDDAHIPLRFIAAARAIDAETKRELLGVRAHPWAFVVQRPWVKGAVVVLLNDPDDPTPYWLVSSRRPQALAAAIEQARAADPSAASSPSSGVASEDVSENVSAKKISDNVSEDVSEDIASE